MTPLVYSGETAFCLTMIIYLFAAFVGVVCFAMSLSYKLKLQFVLPEVGVSAASLMLFCVFADGIAIRRFGADPGEYAGSPCFMPLWSVILIGLTLFTLAAAWLVLVVKKRLSGLTAMSVKEAIAALPTGVCFYDETGRLLLLNDRIERDCREITGEPLYDGNAFWAAISGEEKNGVKITRGEGSVIVENRDGRAVCYKRIAHDFGGKTVYELSGTDISREFALKKETEQKNENLRKMNLRLRKYGEIVAEVTKERETLAARVKVHANLGSLILRTKKSLARGGTDRETLVSEWNDVTSLIFASGEEEDKFAEADKTASSVGVRIFYDGKRPQRGSAAEKIFAAAVFECVVNTVRHADGTELYAKMTDGETEYAVCIADNGKKTSGEITEGGGLSSLRTMTENAGGRMTVSGAPRFMLTITIPKENRTDER